MIDREELFWRETYFVLFPREQRPTLEQVSAALKKANRRYQLENPAADESGFLQSLLVQSAEDHAAVEISYHAGEAVLNQNRTWARQLRADLPKRTLEKLIAADSRLDVAHFERVSAGGWSEDAEDPDSADMLDPTCLLTVVETLAGLTGGLTFDPAAGEILE
jgi:hypothetical protein